MHAMTKKAWILALIIALALIVLAAFPGRNAYSRTTANPDKLFTLYLPMIYPRILQLPLTPTPRPTIQATPTATSAVPPTSIGSTGSPTMATIPPTQTPPP
jgi:hypothetical protein